MTTSAAAGNTAGRAGDKEKVEKRRALGRGLESLLPGPRAVGAPPGQSSAAGGKQQIPHFVRNDKANLKDEPDLVRNDKASFGAIGTPQEEAIAGVIRAKVEEAVEESRAGAPAPHDIAEFRS